jgi:hypothetical protein
MEIALLRGRHCNGEKSTSCELELASLMESDWVHANKTVVRALGA